MKRVLLLIALMFLFKNHAQEILMQNGTLNTCSGTFYDSGGEDGNYSSDENFVLTLCPDVDGEKMRLIFSEFATQLGADIMTIYDGDSTSSSILGTFSGTNGGDGPGIVVANENNDSGCLTIQFISNNAAVTSGWQADVSCFMPCQEIIANLESSFPMSNEDGNIQVCLNEEITLYGSGSFETSGEGATYKWDLDNGTTASGETVTISYNVPGLYIVNLNIQDSNPLGCQNNNLINQVIQVSSPPDFTETQATDDTLCFGETTTITGVANPVPVAYNCPPPVGDTAALPDGSGVTYSTCVTVNCFEQDAIFTDVSQLIDICLNIEHSFLGDLDIVIISPNGQQVALKSFAAGGGGVFLGNPIDNENGEPGIGADYCFTMDADVLLVDGDTEISGTPPGPSIVPGAYLPEESFEQLIGSPLNGDWCIEIVDNLAIDDGYIFSWELNFDPNLNMQDLSFTSQIVSQSWDEDASIIAVEDNVITVAPPVAGQYCYVYRVTDDFGCEYAQEVCINVAEESQEAITYYLDNDGDGFGDPDTTMVDCFEPDGYVTNNLDCDDTDDAINPDAEDMEGNGIDENCDGEDGEVLSLNEVIANGVSISPNPFKTHLNLKIPSDLDGETLGIALYDINGRLVVDTLKSNINGALVIDDLDRLEEALYFIKITSKDSQLILVKKIIKLTE